MDPLMEHELYRSNCNTIKFKFDNFNLESGKTYAIQFQFYNAYQTGGIGWYFDALGDWGSEIAVSEIRIYEKAESITAPNCNAFTGPLTSLTNMKADLTQRRNSFYLESEAALFIGSAGNPEAGCSLCDLYNSGDGYCTSDAVLVSTGFGTFQFLTLEFGNDFDAAGVVPTGGYLILYGAQFDDSTDISMVVNGQYYWINEQKPVVSSSSVNGVYYFCGNCQYMIWTFDIENLNQLSLDGSKNTAKIYVSGDEKLCVAAYKFVFYTKDVQGPVIANNQGFCQKTNSVTYTLSPGSKSTVTLTPNGDQSKYYTANSATDNCEIYNVVDIIPVSLSITQITPWDYNIDPTQHPLQRFTVKDHSDAESYCDTYVVVNFSPAMINYPPSNAQLTITNIIVRWANYGPAIDAQSKVKVWIVPTGSCSSSPTVILADGLSYLTFSYQYRGPTNKIVQSVVGGSTCEYDFYFEISNATIGKKITFKNTKLTFFDITP